MTVPKRRAGGAETAASREPEAPCITEFGVDEFFRELTEPSELVPYMTPADVLSWQIHRAALSTLLNLEPRNFAEIAASLGVHRSAISVSYTRLCAKIGWEPMFRRIETRMKLAMAAKRRRERAE